MEPQSPEKGGPVCAQGATLGAIFETKTGVGIAATSQSDIAVRGDSPGGIAAVHGNGGKNGVWGYAQSGDSGVWGANDGFGNGLSSCAKRFPAIALPRLIGLLTRQRRRHYKRQRVRRAVPRDVSA